MRHQALTRCRTAFHLSHDPDFIAVLVHILGVFRMVGSLAFYPAEAWHIDHVVRLAVRCRGRLRFLLWCGILFRGSLYFALWGRLSRRWLRDNVSFLDQFLQCCFRLFFLWRYDFFRLCYLRNFGLCGDCSSWRGQRGCCLGWLLLRPHSGTQCQTGGKRCSRDDLFLRVASFFSDIERAPDLFAVQRETERSFSN